MQSLHRVEKSPPSDGTGGITVRDLSTQSIIKAFSICFPYRHAAPLEMTVVASAPLVMLKKGRGWRRSLWPSGCRKKEAPHFEELLFHLRGD